MSVFWFEHLHLKSAHLNLESGFDFSVQLLAGEAERVEADEALRDGVALEPLRVHVVKPPGRGLAPVHGACSTSQRHWLQYILSTIITVHSG